jgi:hypothetical protein
MINTERIVPVTAIDLLSLYGLILAQNVSGLTALDATNPGVFEVESASNALIADEPIESLDFASGVSTATVYFVPAYNYVGFTQNGAAITNTGDVDPDGRSLYKAELASGSVTITKVGF